MHLKTPCRKVSKFELFWAYHSILIWFTVVVYVVYKLCNWLKYNTTQLYFILRRDELHWNFSNLLWDTSDIHRFLTMYMIKTQFLKKDRIYWTSCRVENKKNNRKSDRKKGHLNFRESTSSHWNTILSQIRDGEVLLNFNTAAVFRIQILIFKLISDSWLSTLWLCWEELKNYFKLVFRKVM